MRRLLSLLFLAGCAGDDFARPGTWQPVAANDRNLRAMLADPAHAARGIGATTERGEAGASPVGRLLRGERRPLPGPARLNAATGSAGNGTNGTGDRDGR